jgi:hypothetical protein
LDKKKKRKKKMCAGRPITWRLRVLPLDGPTFPSQSPQWHWQGGTCRRNPAVAIERPSSVELKSGKIPSIGCQFKATTKVIAICAFFKKVRYSRVDIKIILIQLGISETFRKIVSTFFVILVILTFNW